MAREKAKTEEVQIPIPQDNDGFLKETEPRPVGEKNKGGKK